MRCKTSRPRIILVTHSQNHKDTNSRKRIRCCCRNNAFDLCPELWHHFVGVYWIRWRLNGTDKYAIRLSIRKKMPRNSYTLNINYDHRLSFASGIGKPILIVQVNCICRYFSISWLLMPRFHRSLNPSRLSPLIADLLPLFASCQRNKVRKLGPQLIAA